MADARQRGRRFRHIEAEVAWAGVEVLDPALQYEIARELATHLANLRHRNSSAGAKVGAAVHSLRTAADILGGPPSLAEYRKLRTTFPQLELVPDGTIRRWLGDLDWDECLSRSYLASPTTGPYIAKSRGHDFNEAELVAVVHAYAARHGDVVPKLDALVAWTHDPRVQAYFNRVPLSATAFERFGGYEAFLRRHQLRARRREGDGAPTDAFTEEELVAAIRDFASENQERRISLYGYLTWARDPETQAKPGRRPISTSPFNRYGGFLEIVARSGVVEERISITGTRLPMCHRYSDEEMIHWLRAFTAELGRAPGRQRYRRLRNARLEAAVSAGELLAIPSDDSIATRFGTWEKALATAADPRASMADPRRRGWRYTESEVRAAIREAWVAVGEPFTTDAYRRWREHELQKPSDGAATLRLPSVFTVVAHFGGWRRAKRACLPDR